MRQKTIVLTAAAMVLMLGVTGAVAQQPMHQHGPGMHGAQHGQQMDMCRQMMGGGMMGMPMMMGGGDPKQQAEMLAMRGEMMKAMGDIMLKYAQRAQPAK
jgi:hypothetical protein